MSPKSSTIHPGTPLWPPQLSCSHSVLQYQVQNTSKVLENKISLTLPITPSLGASHPSSPGWLGCLPVLNAAALLSWELLSLQQTRAGCLPGLVSRSPAPSCHVVPQPYTRVSTCGLVTCLLSSAAAAAAASCHMDLLSLASARGLGPLLLHSIL